MRTYELVYRGNRTPLRQGETLVGRSAFCTVVLGSSRVSRRHCVITLSHEGLFLTDLGSANGTTVNGKAVREPTPLSVGDQVVAGGELLEIALAEPRPRARVITDRSPEEELEETSTARHFVGLELIEELGERASSLGVAARVLPSLQQAVAAIPANFAAEQLERLEIALSKIAEGAPSVEVQAYCRSTLEALAKRTKPWGEP